MVVVEVVVGGSGGGDDGRGDRGWGVVGWMVVIVGGGRRVVIGVMVSGRGRWLWWCWVPSAGGW